MSVSYQSSKEYGSFTFDDWVSDTCRWNVEQEVMRTESDYCFSLRAEMDDYRSAPALHISIYKRQRLRLVLQIFSEEMEVHPYRLLSLR